MTAHKTHILPVTRHHERKASQRKRKAYFRTVSLFGSLYVCYLLVSLYVADSWTVFDLDPLHDSFPTFTLGGAEIDHACYTYWDTVPSPEPSGWWINKIYTRKTEQFWWPQARMAVVSESDPAWYGGSPAQPFLWARNITRSAKRFYSDLVIVISVVFEHLLTFCQQMRTVLKRPVVFIVLSDYEVDDDVQFPDVDLYIIGRNSFHPRAVLAQDQKFSLIEMADLFITFSGWHAKGAGAVETPTIILYGSNHVRPDLNVTWIDSGGSVHLDDVVKQGINMLTRQKKAELVFHSYVDPTMGYGSSAEHMALALDRRGIYLRFHPTKNSLPEEQWPGLVKARTQELVRRTETSDYYLTYVVPHTWEVRALHRLARKAKIAIIYTTFETSQVPHNWIKYVNRYDKLLVSCDEIKKSFIRGGVRIPVDVVTLGVDPIDWPLQERSWSGHPLRFLMYADGEWKNHRKNYEMVYDTFVNTFKDHSDVELVMKLSVRKKVGKDGKPIEEPEGPVSVPPNVRIVKGRLTQKEILELLAQSHVLLFPSKGEGFGLPPREAMATGMPAMFAGFAGLERIASEKIAYPLKWKPADADGYDFWIDENNGSAYFGVWAAPDAADLARRMLEATQSPQRAQQRGRAAAEWVRKYETYDHTGKQLALAFTVGSWSSSRSRPRDKSCPVELLTDEDTKLMSKLLADNG